MPRVNSEGRPSRRWCSGWKKKKKRWRRRRRKRRRWYVKLEEVDEEEENDDDHEEEKEEAEVVVAREIEAHSDNSRIIGCGRCPRHATVVPWCSNEADR